MSNTVDPSELSSSAYDDIRIPTQDDVDASGNPIYPDGVIGSFKLALDTQEAYSELNVDHGRLMGEVKMAKGAGDDMKN